MRARWPKNLIIPNEEQFAHGTWTNHECDESTFDMSDVEEDECRELDKISKMLDNGIHVDAKSRMRYRYSCNTQCCLVGWAALALNEPSCTPWELSNPSTALFLNKFIELSGEEPVDIKKFGGKYSKDFIVETAERASDVFEGLEDFNKLSPQRAHELWKKTAEHFGYDTENLIG